MSAERQPLSPEEMESTFRYPREIFEKKEEGPDQDPAVVAARDEARQKGEIRGRFDAKYETIDGMEKRLRAEREVFDRRIEVLRHTIREDLQDMSDEEIGSDLEGILMMAGSIRGLLESLRSIEADRKISETPYYKDMSWIDNGLTDLTEKARSIRALLIAKLKEN